MPDRRSDWRADAGRGGRLAPRACIEREIIGMPHYFADYDTTVTFVTA